MKRVQQKNRRSRRAERDGGQSRHEIKTYRISSDGAADEGLNSATSPLSKDAGEQYHEVYDLAPIGFYTLDRVGRIRELNDKAAKLLGFSPDWLIGKSFLVFIASQDIQ